MECRYVVTEGDDGELGDAAEQGGLLVVEEVEARVREQVERRRRPIGAAGGLVDVVLVQAGAQHCVAAADGDAEEEDVGVGGDDLGLPGEAAGLLAAAVDAEVGDARRVRGEDGDLDLLVVPGQAGCGGGVAAVGEVGVEVEEGPARYRCAREISAGAAMGRWMQGGGVHGCLRPVSIFFSSAGLLIRRY